MKNSVNRKMINVRINHITWEKFKNHCDKNSYSISKRIRTLIENDMNI